eukprot:TRINITY_DN9_c0_g1_i1.p1 TRINITY_DN9_c0_g1~~TRINITY_DN9_c0_g1_i1.p1  ORF type:complete len:1029 (+),score=368.94 TRINITY_DN9_c0_g1_i1:126-3212(+)
MTESPRKKRKGSSDEEFSQICVTNLMLQRVTDEWKDGILILERNTSGSFVKILYSNPSAKNFFGEGAEIDGNWLLNGIGQEDGTDGRIPHLLNSLGEPSSSFMDELNENWDGKKERKFLFKNEQIRVVFSGSSLGNRVLYNVTLSDDGTVSEKQEKVVDKKAQSDEKCSFMSEKEWLELTQQKMSHTSQLIEWDHEIEDDIKSVYVSSSWVDFHKPPPLDSYSNKWMRKDWGYETALQLRGLLKLALGNSEPFVSERWLPSGGNGTTNVDGPKQFIRGRAWHLNHTKKAGEKSTKEYFLIITEDKTEEFIKETEFKQYTTLRNFFDSVPLVMAVVTILNDSNAIYQQVNATLARAMLVNDPKLNSMTDAEVVERCMGMTMREVGMEEEHCRFYLDGMKKAKGSTHACITETEDPVTKRVYSNLARHMSGDTYLCISTDVTERVNLERALKDQKDHLEVTVKERTHELEEALAVKSRFLATMSHEIRTPLSGIMGGLSFLSEMPGLSNEGREMLRIGQICSQQLLLVINDVLDLSKIEANQVTFEERPLRFKGILEESIEVTSIEANRKKIPLILHSELPHNLILQVDGGRVRQIVLNLLSNSVKFTNSGEIVVTAKMLEDQIDSMQESGENLSQGFVTLQVSVKDTGIGISQQFKDRIFSPFSQSDSSITRKYGGTGLGLSISKRLVEMMGGSLWVDSEVDRGSTFHFTIRALRCSQGIPEEENKRKVLDEILRELQSMNSKNKKKVTIIESNQTQRNEFYNNFKDLDFDVSTYNSIPNFLQSDSIHPIKPHLLLFATGESVSEINGCISKCQKEEDCSIVVSNSSGLLQGSGAELNLLSLGGSNSSLDSLNTLDQLPIGTLVLRKPVQSRRFLLLLDSIFLDGRFNRELEGMESVLKKTVQETKSIEGLKVLVAEDNVMNQRIISKMLKAMGVETKIVDNGKKAIEALELDNYDLILMDCMMPIMGGVEATKYIRSNLPQEKQPKIFALTADVFTENREMCMEAGMNEILTKPINQKDLKEALTRCR